MSASLLLQLLVYASYLFIAIIYTFRTVKFFRMPVHLRWELYPIPHEVGREYGGSYLEELDWWMKPRRRSLFRDIVFMVKDYLYLMQYYQRNRGYWGLLYLWHMGFYLVFGFHLLLFSGAVAMLAGIPVSAESASFLGRAFHCVALAAGLVGFTSGFAGSVGLLIKRMADANLRLYSTPRNYLSYILYLAVFLSGLYAWYFFDPGFATYREFYESLLTFSPVNMDPASAAHIVLFALFLVYMPFTPALHYVTKLFAFFGGRWNDSPSLKGRDMEKRIQRLLKQPVTWSAPHIQPAKSWEEAVLRTEGM